MPVKKTTNSAAKKTAAKKTAAINAPVKKAAAKKVAAAPKTAPAQAPVKKVVAAKSPVKKAVKRAVSVKAAETSIIASVDVGFGNSLYIRGEGADLSWEKGMLLDNISPYEWAFKTSAAKGDITFKFLINDEAWADGEDLTVAAGGISVSSPVFNW